MYSSDRSFRIFQNVTSISLIFLFPRSSRSFIKSHRLSFRCISDLYQSASCSCTRQRCTLDFPRFLHPKKVAADRYPRLWIRKQPVVLVTVLEDAKGA